MWTLIKLTIKAWWYHVIKALFSTELSSYCSIYRVISWASGSLAHLGWDVAWAHGDHKEPNNCQYFLKISLMWNLCCKVAIFKLCSSSFIFALPFFSNLPSFFWPPVFLTSNMFTPKNLVLQFVSPCNYTDFLLGFVTAALV